MPGYDSSGMPPPAPVAIVTLRNSSTAALVSDVALLLDTGADVTLLPRAQSNDLGSLPRRT